MDKKHHHTWRRNTALCDEERKRHMASVEMVGKDIMCHMVPILIHIGTHIRIWDSTWPFLLWESEDQK